MVIEKPRRATPPFRVRGSAEAYWVEDAHGLRFGYCYFEDRQVIGTGVERPSRDLARRLATWIARLPDLAAADVGAALERKKPPG